MLAVWPSARRAAAVWPPRRCARCAAPPHSLAPRRRCCRCRRRRRRCPSRTASVPAHKQAGSAPPPRARTPRHQRLGTVATPWRVCSSDSAARAWQRVLRALLATAVRYVASAVRLCSTAACTWVHRRACRRRARRPRAALSVTFARVDATAHDHIAASPRGLGLTCGEASTPRARARAAARAPRRHSRRRWCGHAATHRHTRTRAACGASGAVLTHWQLVGARVAAASAVCSDRGVALLRAPAGRARLGTTNRRLRIGTNQIAETSETGSLAVLQPLAAISGPWLRPLTNTECYLSRLHIG